MQEDSGSVPGQGTRSHTAPLKILHATTKILQAAAKAQRGQIKKDCLGIPWQSSGRDSVLTAGAQGSMSGSGTKIPEALREEKKKTAR